MTESSGKSQFIVTNAGTPSLKATASDTRFKLKLSPPGKDIKGNWLCRALG